MLQRIVEGLRVTVLFLALLVLSVQLYKDYCTLFCPLSPHTPVISLTARQLAELVQEATDSTLFYPYTVHLTP